MSRESHQKREIETNTQEQAISSTRVEQVFLLGRTPAEVVFLENFITHPTEYDGLKPPKWLEKGTHTQWDTDTKNGTLTAHHDNFPITAITSEEELARFLSEAGMQPHQVLVVTSSETPTEIILSKKKLSPQDSSLAEKGYQVATVGGMRKTGDQRFDSFRKAWGFLIGQTTYFLDATPKPTEEEHSEGFLSGAWFGERKINHKPRFVAGTDGTTHTIEDFEFFYKPDETTLHRINALIERARQTGERPVLYIPTCPPDTYYYSGGNAIEYGKSDPLKDGIAWTAENTLDALEALLPEFARAGVAPEIVMGLGDYEYFLGYTRGMTQEAFQTIVNKSIHHLAHRIQHLVAQTYGTSLPQEVKQNTNGVIEIAMEASSALPKVRITGMMELAGGKSHWDKRFDLARDEARKIFGETRYQRLAQRTLANRQAMVDHWLTLRGQEITEGARIDEFTSRDLPSYIAFHKMIQELFGNRLIVLAGDSRPMEMFASTYTYNPLISVSGLYAGADFK